MINQLFKAIKSRQFILVILRAMGVGLLFLATLIMTNYYEKIIVGRFEFTRSILVLIGAIALLGTDSSILQIAGLLKSKNKLNQFLSVYKKVIRMILVVSIILFVFISVIAYVYPFHDQQDFHLYIKVLGSVFFYAVALFNTEVFRVFELDYWAEIYRGILKYITLFIGVVVLLWLDETEFVVELFLISFIVLAVLSTFHILPLIRPQNASSELSYKRIFNISLPMALSGLGFFLLLTIDVLFLKYYLDEEAVALYAQPIKIITIIAMIQTTLQASISQNIATYFYAGEREKLIAIIVKYTRIITLMSVPFLLVFLIFPAKILSLFGEGYDQGSNLLLILLFGTFINAICGCTGVYMNMTGKQVVFRNIIFLTILINLVLNYLLIPKYGMTGAAIASSFSLSFWNMVTLIYVYKKDRIILMLR